MGFPVPTSSAKPDGDSVTVEVRGANYSDLSGAAINIAAEYFGITCDSEFLRLSSFNAEPWAYNTDGSVREYRAQLKVYYSPVILGQAPSDDSGPGELAATGSSSRSFGSAVRPQRTNRPVGPISDEEDDFDDIDEDESDLDDD